MKGWGNTEIELFLFSLSMDARNPTNEEFKNEIYEKGYGIE